MFKILSVIAMNLIVLTAAQAETLREYIESTYQLTNAQEQGLSQDAFTQGVIGFFHLKKTNATPSKEILAILDFTQSSSKKRFYFFDLNKRQLIHQTYGAHGKNSGEEFATKFSNIPDSNQSSLGFYSTENEPYYGKHGLSLRLIGHDVGFNDKAYERSIVLHGADYATGDFISETGRLGRSWGCPAVPPKETNYLINLLQERGIIFMYAADKRFEGTSKHLDRNLLNETIDF